MKKFGFIAIWISVFLIVLLVDSSFSYAESSVMDVHSDTPSDSTVNQYHPDKNISTVRSASYLDTGLVINSKMKALSSREALAFEYTNSSIKAICKANTLPEHFVPSESNTISADSSPVPVYIFFDNSDNAGIIYVYTEGDRIYADSSLAYVLYYMFELSDISGLAEWDVSLTTDMSYAFYEASSLTDISALSNWDTGNVMYFAGTFCGAGIIDATPLSNWNTSSAVSMERMFVKAKALRTIDVSSWDTGKVTNMSRMFCVGDNFEGNGQLREIRGIGNWDVSSVTDMTCMFYGAGNMFHYDIAGWDVSNVQSFNHMFCDNFRLKSLDLSAWNVSNVRTMFDMFDDNFALTTIGDVSHWDTSSLIDVGGWLNGCKSFVGDNGTLDLSGWNTENLQNAGEMFRAVKLKTIDLSGWTFDSITNDPWPDAGSGIYYESGNLSDYKGLAGMFLNASELTAIYFSSDGYESLKKADARGIILTEMVKGTQVKNLSIK